MKGGDSGQSALKPALPPLRNNSLCDLAMALTVLTMGRHRGGVLQGAAGTAGRVFECNGDFSTTIP
jgi:hypothetical protein